MEQFLQPNDSCRLMVHNLFSYVVNPFTKGAYFDYTLFYNHCYEGLRLGDDLVDLEAEYIQRIIDKIKSDPESDIIKLQELMLWEKSLKICLEGRRVGMGITALGDTLAALGFKYDSDKALIEIEQIMQTKMGAELDCTIDLSILRGSFKGWNNKLEFGEHSKILNNNDTLLVNTKEIHPFYHFMMRKFPSISVRMHKFGRRNVNWSTIAPTGSVSLLADNCTSGCEPLFSPYYFRKKKINPGQENTRVDFVDQNGDSWQEFPVLHPKFKDWIDSTRMKGTTDYSKEDLEVLFKESPWYNSTANDIDWLKRVEIQAILQKYTTNAISSTINLPSTVTYEEVSNIYMEGWKKGLKGQTIYVDGCRTGVLTTNSSSNTDNFTYQDAVKRPKTLVCNIHQSTTQGENWLIIVSLMNEKPYEVFCVPNTWNLPKSKLIGNLIKEKKGHYRLSISDVMGIENINLEANEYQTVTSRLISTALRHGTDIKYIVEQLSKVEGELFSFNKSLARILKKYIPDGAKSTITCDNCGSTNVIYEEGCSSCKECGSSKCG